MDTSFARVKRATERETSARGGEADEEKDVLLRAFVRATPLSTGTVYFYHELQAIAGRAPLQLGEIARAFALGRATRQSILVRANSRPVWRKSAKTRDLPRAIFGASPVDRDRSREQRRTSGGSCATVTSRRVFLSRRRRRLTSLPEARQASCHF